MKKITQKLLLSTFLCFCAAISFAQQREITGTVKDNKGVPVANASVIVKGTTKGVATNADGNFSIMVTGSKPVLVISSVGFKPMEFSVGESNHLELALESAAGAMQEVVVTALGITKSERSLGYATSTVTGADLDKASPTNFASALAGKASGVMITSNPGGATSAVGIQIRGINSIGYQRQPLMVVDGIIIRDGDANTQGYWGGNQKINGNGLLDINPDDIASISILKGAAASALYGSDAAFGVIVITTKSGKNHRRGIGVDVNLSSAVENVAILPDIQMKYGPGYDWVDDNAAYGNDSAWTSKVVNGQTVSYPAFNNGGYQFGSKIDGRPVYYADGVVRPFEATNYWKDFYRQGGGTIANIALSNSSDKGSYRFSYTRNDYKGVQVGGRQQKNTFNLNTIFKITPKLTLSIVTNYTNELVHNRPRQIYFLTNNSGSFPSPANYMNIFFNKYQTPQGYKYYSSTSTIDPTNRFKYDFDGEPFLDFMWDQLANSDNETTNRLIASTTLNYNILPGLNLRGRIGTDFTGYRQEEEDRTTQPIAYGPSGGYGLTNNEYTFFSGDLLMSYNRQIKKNFDFTLSAGYQARQESYYYNSASTIGGLTVENWFSLESSASQTNGGTGTASASRQFLTKDGLFGILDMSFKNLLYVSGTVRHERSSTLYPGNNEFTYPGVSGALELTRLFHFPEVVNYSKLRAAWGIVGNPPDQYIANVVYNPSSINGIPALTPPSSNYGNNALKNEFKHETEFGWETRFLNNRLGFDISYYTNTIYNQIVPLNTPSNIGSSSVLVNIGTMGNHGVEGSLFGTPLKSSDFSWDTRINFSFNRNKVISLAAGQSTYVMSNIDNGSMEVVANPGSPSGDIMGYVPGTYSKGGERIIASNGLYQIDKSHLVKVGNIQPKVVGGFINTFNYKNFSLNVLVDYHWGGQVISLARFYGTGQGVYKNSLYGRDAASGGMSYYSLNNGGMGTYVASQVAGPNGEVVHHDGIILKGVTATGQTNTTIVDAPNYYINTFSWGAWPGYDPNSDYPDGAVFNNNFIKLRELSLSYSLPVKLANKFKAQSLVLSIYGRNLFYIYKSLPGFDPEDAVGTNYLDYSTSIGTGNAATRSIGGSLRVSF